MLPELPPPFRLVIQHAQDPIHFLILRPVSPQIRDDLDPTALGGVGPAEGVVGEPAADEAGAKGALGLAEGEVPEELEGELFGLVAAGVGCDVAGGDGGGGVGHGAEAVEEGFEGGGELGGPDGEGAWRLWV